MDEMVELFGGGMMSPVPNPYPVYRKLREERPVFTFDGPLGPCSMVTRYDDVLAALKDAETYSSKGNARGIGLVMGRTILEMDGKEHLRQRRIVTPAFSPRALRDGLDEVVARVVNQLIDEFEREGRADLVQQFTFTFPLRVIAHVLGIPIGDFHQFHHLALDLLAIAEDPVRGLDASQKLVAYLQPILDERRREPRADLVSTLLHAEVEGERLSDEEVLGFLRLLLPAGAETTYRLTGSLIFALLSHPEVLEEVRADRTVLSLAIEETLRWESAVQYVSRETTVDTEISGVPVPAGTLVMLGIGSANRDEHRFLDPDVFSPRREDVSAHLAFGFGEHFCLGSNLARLEMIVAFQEWLRAFPGYSLDPSRKTTWANGQVRGPRVLPVLTGR